MTISSQFVGQTISYYRIIEKMGGLAEWHVLKAPPDHSVAVLPFVSASRDANSNDLSDSITEGVIDTVSQVPNVKFRIPSPFLSGNRR